MRWRPRVLVAPAVLTALVALSACGGDGGSDGPEGTTSTTAATSASTTTPVVPATVRAGSEDIAVSSLVAGVSAVCTAATGARSGDIGSARAGFFGSAHETMHDLARAVAASDRSAAARLLEAKQAVEADLSSTAAPETLAAHLFGLFDAATVALDRLAISAPPCQK